MTLKPLASIGRRNLPDSRNGLTVAETIMLLMQYRFDVEDDHDMRALRERISVIGPNFNSLAGLVQKAFLVSLHTHGRPHRYAPFYVWQDDEAMNAFLLSDAFARVCAKYGRPTVRASMTLHSQTGSFSQVPAHATQEFISVDPSTDLRRLASEEKAMADAAGHDERLHSIHVGLDTTMWQLVRTCFWHQPSETTHGIDAYDLEYLAFPHRELLSA